jgi:dihydroorotate dehydrogenase (fumarate)
MVEDLDQVRRLEDAGAPAIVMHSLFEEQIVGDPLAAPGSFRLGPDEYLEQVRRIKQAVRVPVIASLNGSTPEGWLGCARLIEQAGADALELNVYFLSTDPERSGEQVERSTIQMLKALKAAVHLPIAVKLSPFYSSLAHFARRLDASGAAGLVLFNRFYQPELDIETLEVRRTIAFSDPSELLLRLRWLAILSGRVGASLAATGGVHTGLDAVRALMAGAHAVQTVSALLAHGPEHLRTMRDELARWLEEHEYESVRQIQGSMSLLCCPDPRSYERVNYVRTLQDWSGPTAATPAAAGAPAHHPHTPQSGERR